GRNLHAGLDHVQGGSGHADRRVDVVDLTGGVDQAGHLDGIVDPGAAFDQLVTTDAYTQCPVRPDGGTHGVNDLQQQPGPVVQRAAVVVVALVGGRGEESPDDRRVRALQFD